MRLLLAIRCFFLVLFAGRLPADATRLLPAPPPPEPPRLPPGPSEADLATMRKDSLSRGAVHILSLLQREGRLIDFLQEDITSYADAQVGAAVRDIHKGCKRALAEHVKVEPVLAQLDGAPVDVAPGFDPSRIKLVGNVVGQPPWKGILRHPGWRGAGIALPELTAAADPTVLAPAEVELS
jgi:hypothetical protein